MNNRVKIIGKLWEKMHGKYMPIFYWSDDTETSYFYDEKTDTIMSDNGFCVPVEKNTEELTEDYIRKLIRKLKTIIILYYRHVLNYELYDYYD